MPLCTRKGCGKEFVYGDGGCIYHSGTPVFHEGLKSWSCCSDANKPVLDFEEFMKIPGCTRTDYHTDEPPRLDTPRPTPHPNLTLSGSDPGRETYISNAKTSVVSTPTPDVPTPVSVLTPEEEDDMSVPITPGALCRRTGCGTSFVSDDINRHGEGEDTVCKYHPAPPVFHEGSKGYMCCKRRVLEFDEFLKIPGCKIGRHLFSSKPKSASDAEEMATCRIDHYQTVDRVNVTIFAKHADKERTSITFGENQIHLNIGLPGPKRFSRVLDLFGPIDPTQSTVQYFGSKVELHLKKFDNRSWTMLERTTHDIGNFSLTFGVGGRTGTVGGKEPVLDENNKAKS